MKAVGSFVFLVVKMCSHVRGFRRFGGTSIPFSGLSVNRLRVWSGCNTVVKFISSCDPL